MADPQSKMGAAEAFRKKKWETLFNFLDTNRDGILEYDELMLFPKRLRELGKLEVAELLTSTYVEAWTRLCDINNMPRDSKSFTRFEWVRASEMLSKTDWFVESFVPTLSTAYFESLDTDQDGFVSLEEWRVYMKNRGMENEDVIQSTFKRLDRDGDGKISRDEVKYAITQFELGEDPNDDYSFIYELS